MTCSLFWVRCLFDLILMSDFGGKWPLKWNFPKCISWFRDGTPNYVSWKFATKFGEKRPLQSSWNVAWFTKQKNSGSAGLVPVPILAKIADRAQNSLNVVTPWPVHATEFGPAAFCRTYSGKIDFSAQKVNRLQYRLLAYNYKNSSHRMRVQNRVEEMHISA